MQVIAVFTSLVDIVYLVTPLCFILTISPTYLQHPFVLFQLCFAFMMLMEMGF